MTNRLFDQLHIVRNGKEPAVEYDPPALQGIRRDMEALSRSQADIQNMLFQISTQVQNLYQLWGGTPTEVQEEPVREPEPQIAEEPKEEALLQDFRLQALQIIDGEPQTVDVPPRIAKQSYIRFWVDYEKGVRDVREIVDIFHEEGESINRDLRFGPYIFLWKSPLPWSETIKTTNSGVNCVQALKETYRIHGREGVRKVLRAAHAEGYWGQKIMKERWQRIAQRVL